MRSISINRYLVRLLVFKVGPASNVIFFSFTLSLQTLNSNKEERNLSTWSLGTIYNLVQIMKRQNVLSHWFTCSDFIYLDI